MFDIWNSNNELAESAYKQKNYKIVENNQGSKTCVIYFASNNIWYPNEESAFRDAILKRDRYEWTTVRRENVQKEIFVRDFYKSWYVTGINFEIDTVDKLIELIRRETEGYSIITVGSSAGGYMAALCAAKMDAKFALCFSPQFDLETKYSLKKNPLLQKYQKDLNRSQYYNISDIIKNSQTTVFYFCPINNVADAEQEKCVNQVSNVQILRFNTARHGVIVPRECLRKILNMEKGELLQVFNSHKGKTYNPLVFTIKVIGIRKTIRSVVGEICKKLKYH